MSTHVRWNKDYILSILDNHIIDYPTPINITYAWSFGALAGICLVVQIVTGIFLAMHYTPHIDLAFSSVEHIMRDVNNGWLIRYMHANGASMFFIVVYSHIFRGLYYGSYMTPRELLWCSGVLIFLLMMATAFLGYVLPWGQMSFWGATVITSLVTAVPVVGQSIVDWLWGGFTVNNATLNRFFSLHFLLPFVILGLTGLHIALLHKDGSNHFQKIENNNVVFLQRPQWKLLFDYDEGCYPCPSCVSDSLREIEEISGGFEDVYRPFKYIDNGYYIRSFHQ